MSIEKLFDNADRNARYGVNETGNIAEFTADFSEWLRLKFSHQTVALADPRLVKILRLRLIGACRDFPFWELQYCLGRLEDGTNVRVNLGRDQFSRFTYRQELVELAKGAGRYGRGMGLLDNISTLEDD